MLLVADNDPLIIALIVNEFILSIGSTLRFLILFKKTAVLFAVSIILDGAQALSAIVMLLIMDNGAVWHTRQTTHTNMRLA